MTQPRPLPIVAALEWAFATEHATLDLDDDTPRPKQSTEAMLMQRAKLGGVRVDGGGRSLPHDDAQTLAWIVCRLPPEDRLFVSELARARMMPDWMPGEVARLVPREWNTKSRHGRWGKIEVIATYTEVFTVPHPRNPEKRIERRRAVQVEWVPCTWDPHPQELAWSHGRYERWWVALDLVKERAQAANLRSIRITDDMPPFQPWA